MEKEEIVEDYTDVAVNFGIVGWLYRPPLGLVQILSCDEMVAEMLLELVLEVMVKDMEKTLRWLPRLQTTSVLPKLSYPQAIVYRKIYSQSDPTTLVYVSKVNRKMASVSHVNPHPHFFQTA